jgi:hypothetical protein
VKGLASVSYAVSAPRCAVVKMGPASNAAVVEDHAWAMNIIGIKKSRCADALWRTTANADAVGLLELRQEAFMTLARNYRYC